MHFGKLSSTAAVLLASLPFISASFIHSNSKLRDVKRQVVFPKPATGMKTLTTPTNVTIRYKEPGKEGVCETTEGVNSYSGYIDLSPTVHMFFWFFESRRNPAEDDFTLWLNGGPGSDSLIGLFEELGPCRITEDLESIINPYSWNNVSNMLFLSQPVGVSFSYQEMQNGSYGNYSGTYLNSTYQEPTGTWPILDPLNVGEIDTTDLAAVAAWHTLQAFLEGLPQLEGNRASKVNNFNLWTESYGGHYGPSFFNYFQEQNEKITNGTMPGYAMNFNTLGIINGIIDETIQSEYYPKFAVNNTYGIKLYNDTVYNYAMFANNMINGCVEQIQSCIYVAADVQGGNIGRVSMNATSNPSLNAVCAEAQAMCRDNVEGLYYSYGDRGTYDIRHPSDDPTPPSYFDYLNQAKIQNAIGVGLNYTSSNTDIYYQFQTTGDFVYPNFLLDLQNIVDSGVRVGLFYGDADYICNWFGGEAVSKQLNHTTKEQFNAAGYQPFMWNGSEYGEVREYGNFSFTRVYEAGHEVPFYQPQAALAFFERMLSGLDIAEGNMHVTANLSTSGPANATHTQASVALPATDSAALAAYSSSIIASYYSLDAEAPPATMVTVMSGAAGASATGSVSHNAIWALTQTAA